MLEHGHDFSPQAVLPLRVRSWHLSQQRRHIPPRVLGLGLRGCTHILVLRMAREPVLQVMQRLNRKVNMCRSMIGRLSNHHHHDHHHHHQQYLNLTQFIRMSNPQRHKRFQVVSCRRHTSHTSHTSRQQCGTICLHRLAERCDGGDVVVVFGVREA